MAQQSSPVRVLVVDDDAMSRDLLGVLMEAEGYVVERAASGDAALALLEEGLPAPEIILADMQMPGITGSELAEALRRSCGPNTLLLAMSGSGSPGKVVSRFDGFLLKPFTVRDMVEAVAARRVAGGKTAPPRNKRSKTSDPGAHGMSAPTVSSPAGEASNYSMNSELEVAHMAAAGADDETRNNPADDSTALDDRIYK
jgi:CheY-like chemotaxis protein